jgi:hypothetical protein
VAFRRAADREPIIADLTGWLGRFSMSGCGLQAISEPPAYFEINLA